MERERPRLLFIAARKVAREYTRASVGERQRRIHVINLLPFVGGFINGREKGVPVCVGEVFISERASALLFNVPGVRV